MYKPILDPLRSALERRGMATLQKAEDDPPTAQFRVAARREDAWIYGVVLFEHANRRIIVQLVEVIGKGEHEVVGIRLEHDLPQCESKMRFASALEGIAAEVVAMFVRFYSRPRTAHERQSEDSRWVPTEDCCRDK